MALTKQPLLNSITAENEKKPSKPQKVPTCSQSHFGVHPTKVIDNCSHGNPNLEIDLKLRGEPVEESALNVQKVSGRLRIQIFLSLFFFGVEFITGIISGSIALIADSYHMAADVMALIVAFICLRMADKQSKSNSYGWVRTEALGGFFNGLFLLTVCLSIFQEASGRILHPKVISQPLHVLAVGVIGLLINLIGLFLLNGQGHGHSHGGGGHSGNDGHSHSNAKNNGHSHSHQSNDKKSSQCTSGLLENEESESKSSGKGKPRANTFSLERRFTGPTMPYATRMASEWLEPELSDDANDDDDDNQENVTKRKKSKNVNIHGVYLHLMSDAFGSVIVIFAASCVYFWPEWSWSKYFDPVLSLCLATMMSFSAIGLVRDSVNILLMKAPNGFVNKNVMADLRKIVGVADVTNVNIWSLTGSRLLASVKANFCHPAVFADAAFKIRKYFHDVGIHSTTIEPTFEPDCMESMRITVEECQEENNHRLTLSENQIENEQVASDPLNVSNIIETTIDMDATMPSNSTNQTTN